MQLKPSDVTACLVTRGDVPQLIADRVDQFRRLGMQVAVWDNSVETDKKVYGRYMAAERANTAAVFFQDDDIVLTDEQILNILEHYEPGVLVSNMYDEWIESMGYTDLAMVGLGAVCDNGLWRDSFLRFIEEYGDSEERLLLDPDFIFGTLTPYRRYDFGHEILPEASADNRLWKQEGQHERKYETVNMARDLRRICLTIMAKDEEGNIRRALESTVNVYDEILLLDTGSTDDTITVVEAFAGKHGKPLTVVEAPFSTFRDMRNLLFEEGRKLAEYQLLMDADEEWTPCARSDFGSLWGDGYMLHYDGSVDYAQPRLIASRFPWRFTGERHSYLDTDHPSFQAVVVNMKHPRIIHHGDDRHGMDKVLADIAWLETEIEATTDDLPRNLFLLGKAFDFGHDNLKAIDAYRRRIELSTGDEESYWSKYRLGCLTCETLNDLKTGIELLWEAYQDRPSRVEALRAMAFYCTAVADATPYPEDDHLLVMRNMYRSV